MFKNASKNKNLTEISLLLEINSDTHCWKTRTAVFEIKVLKLEFDF